MKRQRRQGLFYARIRAFRKTVLAAALEQHKGSRTETAKYLGLNRTYLAKLISYHGLEVEFPPTLGGYRHGSPS